MFDKVGNSMRRKIKMHVCVIDILMNTAVPLHNKSVLIGTITNPTTIEKTKVKVFGYISDKLSNAAWKYTWWATKKLGYSDWTDMYRAIER